MDKIIVTGGRPLHGNITIAGAKNAALPLMAASLLTSKSIHLENVPYLSDIDTMAKLLMNHDVQVEMPCAQNGERMLLTAENVNNFKAPYDIVRKMRASVLVLGPLLARFGQASVSLPGGCAIGVRPINLHLDALSALGAEISLKEGYIEAHIKTRLRGAEIHFPFVSVGATENVLMAATLADGTTVIHNAAQEPEISDLAKLLIEMGAKIEGAGTKTITIQGVTSLHGANHKIISDRLEAGTYAIAALITGGELILENVQYEIFSNIAERLVQIGGVVEQISPSQVRVKCSGRKNAIDIATSAYPGFPTDMQAQFMSLLAVSHGTSIITENIFENRYMHVLELLRMGADISVSGHIATINGISQLCGAEVMATDLRASVSLVLAGLCAQGKTVISRVYHIDRGYEKIEEKLGRCGAIIERVR